MQFDVDGYRIEGGAIKLVQTPDGVSGITEIKVTDAADIATIEADLKGMTDADGPGVRLRKTGDGTLSLTGVGDIEGDVLVSSGTLNIALNGVLTSHGNGIVADTVGSKAKAVVDDATWEIADSLTVGLLDLGEVEIMNGGKIIAVNDVQIGSAAEGTGVIILSGAGELETPSLLVGREGHGTLHITEGTVSAGGTTIGALAGSTGMVMVAGANSTLTTVNDLTVGASGDGTLDVHDSGVVNSGSAMIAFRPEATGTATIDGATWNITSSLSVGAAVDDSTGGKATLTIANGGEVNVGGNVLVGGTTGFGVINIGAAEGSAAEGAGTLDTPTVDLGDKGQIVFNHDGEPYVFVPNITGTGEAGEAVKVLAGTTIFTADNDYDEKTVIGSGATLQLGDGAGGGAAGAIAGDASIANGGTLIFNRSNAYTHVGAISGQGQVEQTGGGVTTLTADSSDFVGSTSVNNGVLRIGSAASPNAVLGGAGSSVSVGNATGGSATLGGSGVIGGGVTVGLGGILAPNAGGTTTASTLTIDGDLTLTGDAALKYNFGDGAVAGLNQPGGGASNDLVNVGGKLTLDGTIDVNNGPLAGGIYRVFNYDGNLDNQGLALGDTVDDGAYYVQTSIDGQVNLINKDGLNLHWWDGTVAAAGTNRNEGTVNGGDGVWTRDANDNWTTVDGDINASYDNASYSYFTNPQDVAVTGGTVTLDNGNGQVISGGMEFLKGGYEIVAGEGAGDDTLKLAQTPGGVAGVTVIKVADQNDTATIAVDLDGAGVGLQKTGDGTLKLTGTATLDGETHADEGILLITGGGQVSDSAGSIGSTPGSDGVVTVDGGNGGATWTNTTQVDVGVSGQGTLNIANGGKVIADNVTVGGNPGSGVIHIGAADGLAATGATTGAGVLDANLLTLNDTGSLEFTHNETA
jgi:fibronectin-binding autotransporter adhesin